MRFVNFLVLFVLTTTWTFGQTSPATEPFILKGKLTNFTKGKLVFGFVDIKTGYIVDTIKVDSSGNFYLKTYAVTEPKKAVIMTEGLFVEIYAAPGYDLLLTGDVKDVRLFMKQKKISGKGAESNQYLINRDIFNYSKTKYVDWSGLKETELVEYVGRERQVSDSLYNTVFTRKVNDKWFSHFASITTLNNKFTQMLYLFSLATYDEKISPQRAMSFVTENNPDKKFLENMFAEENYVSEIYYNEFLRVYAEFLLKQAKGKDPNYGRGGREDFLLLDQIATNFKGQAKEFHLCSKINEMISYSRSFESLIKIQKDLPDYIALLKDPKAQQKLTELAAAKETELMAAQVGKPAPLFTASDSSGSSYQLSDFKGKVVYLDLWASWCGPCRAETPHLKELIKKFTGNEDVTFISVAVHDKPDKWREALIKDTPTGLQLYDGDGTVKRSYFASSIPKFVLINKKGEIVSFDAPAPSSGKEVEELLLKETQN